jgi:hypothetical protein
MLARARTLRKSKDCGTLLTIADNECVDCGDNTSEEGGKLKHLHGRGTLAVRREDKRVCWGKDGSKTKQAAWKRLSVVNECRRLVETRAA